MCSRRTNLEWNSALTLSYVQGSVLLQPSISSKSRMITDHIFLTCFHFTAGIQYASPVLCTCKATDLTMPVAELQV